MTSRRVFLAAIAAGATFAALPALAQQDPVRAGSIEVSGAFLRASPMVAHAAAAFMTISSDDGADRLIAFRSPACERPELHTHVHDNGMMRMRQVEAIDIPENGAAVLQPGGLHLMFIDLTGELEEGSDVPVTLIFEKAGEVELSVPVKGPGAMK